jgi:hypothetical protein
MRRVGRTSSVLYEGPLALYELCIKDLKCLLSRTSVVIVNDRQRSLCLYWRCLTFLSLWQSNDRSSCLYLAIDLRFLSCLCLSIERSVIAFLSCLCLSIERSYQTLSIECSYQTLSTECSYQTFPFSLLIDRRSSDRMFSLKWLIESLFQLIVPSLFINQLNVFVVFAYHRFAIWLSRPSLGPNGFSILNPSTMNNSNSDTGSQILTITHHRTTSLS